MNSDVLINFVLDKSGSMLSNSSATIEGFNSFMDDQRALPGDARVSLTLFDTSFEARFVATPIAQVPPLGSPDNTYLPGGMTALLDAVGTTIKGTEGWLANHPEFNGRVVCVVMTDGVENSSLTWHIHHPLVDGDDRDLAGLIKWKQTEGWEFVFLGGGGSQWLERTFGHVVDRSRILSFGDSSAGYESAYGGVSRAVSATRTTGAVFDVDGGSLVR